MAGMDICFHVFPLWVLERESISLLKIVVNDIGFLFSHLGV